MNYQKLIESLRENPKKLFLIDGLGAIISAFMLGIVLVRFESLFGIPMKVLYLLASLPVLFALYDFYCFISKSINLGKSLKSLSIINLSYCFLSLFVTIYHYKPITYFGWIYVIGEILIVAVLAIIEFTIGKEISRIS